MRTKGREYGMRTRIVLIRSRDEGRGNDEGGIRGQAGGRGQRKERRDMGIGDEGEMPWG